MGQHKVAMLTAGGLAPCLAASLGKLIERYQQEDPSIDIICYRDGYKGLLKGESIRVGESVRQQASTLCLHGGSPIGNSRVKLTNVADCVKRGLVADGEDPLAVAATQLQKDGVTVLHTIGGDDTNTMAAALAAYLAEHNYALTVVGLPKTVDNDVFPITQTLGAATAADQGAVFFENVVNEFGANPRMLIVHEVMGRSCGWLTAATARQYRARLQNLNFLPDIGLSAQRKDVHGVYIPELDFDPQQEAKRLRTIMDELDCVNLFVSEGAGLDTIAAEMEAAGVDIARDAFGHIKLDTINPGQWFAKTFAGLIGAEKVLVQKSGYFARSAKPNDQDLALIEACAAQAVASAVRGDPGVVGHDEDADGQLRTIEFARIKGGKSFEPDTPWFRELLTAIGQR